MTSRVEFTDDDGVRWTVSHRPTAKPGLVRLEFESEAGERRASDVFGLDEREFTEVDDATWRMLVHGAPPDRVPPGHGP